MTLSNFQKVACFRETEHFCLTILYIYMKNNNKINNEKRAENNARKRGRRIRGKKEDVKEKAIKLK